MAEFGILAAGLVLLLMGGDGLVRGAAEIARRSGVPPVVIGLTVVAFGTSTPELVVNLAAAFRGSTEIGFGNVVGSNTANIGLILGVAALVAPLTVHRTIVVREIPMMLGASGAVVVMAWGGATAGFARGEGAILLLFFGVFLGYAFRDALRSRRDAFLEVVVQPEAIQPGAAIVRPGPRASALLVVGGLGALVAGGELTVRGAIGIAQAIGIPEAIVGLTIVAVGTSLPELATSALAAWRGQADVAVGNVVGSNLYNLLFIWGTSVTVAPSPLPAGGLPDLLVMTGFAILLVPLVLTRGRISRGEGALLLAAYAGYVTWLALR